ncbi:hypothetical protein [Nannocystis pusilla]|uniref:hypothetical protein n=1 Tax=Nannocystis pusilla TaxID=889268 RepID=UPI003B75D9EA
MCWALYLSLDRAVVLVYPWDSLLLEAGFGPCSCRRWRGRPRWRPPARRRRRWRGCSGCCCSA